MTAQECGTPKRRYKKREPEKDRDPRLAGDGAARAFVWWSAI